MKVCCLLGNLSSIANSFFPPYHPQLLLICVVVSATLVIIQVSKEKTAFADKSNSWIPSGCKLMSFLFYFVQGVDPDAPEEDEENEVEDADGDQEAELL